MGSVSTEEAAAAAAGAGDVNEGIGGGGGNYEEIERSKVGIMRALLLRELADSSSSSKEVDDLMIRRFLRARNLDIEKATNLFLKYLNWRKEFVPNGSVSPSDISNQLAQNKLFMQGLDKMGRPIVVCFGGRHKHTSLEEFKRFVTYSLDQICARMPSGQEKFVCIGDLEGWGYSSSDVRGYLAALSILQDCYPERLGKLIIVHVPYIFMTAWKAVYPFIDSKTKMKIIFVDSKRLRSTLLSDIDESQLPDIYGGILMWYWAVTRRGASIDNITEFLRKRENILLEFEEKRVSYFPSPHIISDLLLPDLVEKKKD